MKNVASEERHLELPEVHGAGMRCEGEAGELRCLKTCSSWLTLQFLCFFHVGRPCDFSQKAAVLPQPVHWKQVTHFVEEEAEGRREEKLGVEAFRPKNTGFSFIFPLKPLTWTQKGSDFWTFGAGMDPSHPKTRLYLDR